MIDGEAVVFRPDNTSDFEALRSREGQAGAILVAYDLMEANGQDIRPEPVEERRKRLAKLLSRSNKRSPATARRSSVTRALWTSKGSSRSALVRGTSAAGCVLG